MDLLFPTRDLVKSTSGSKAELLQEGHNRFSQATLSFVAALIGFVTLMIGSFSRFGLWRQILVAVVILILLKSFDNLMADFALGDEKLWPLVYVPTVAGIALLWVLFLLSSRPAIFRRWKRPTPS
jgi:lipopolysaccharide export system permease protein